MTRVLLIPGSTHDRSLHTAALRTAARFAPAGFTVTRYDGLRDLPAFVPGEQPPEVVTALRRQVRDADALLVCTPEYAGSLPGSLKNLFDHLVDAGDLDGKPAAWLSVALPGQDEGAYAALETVLSHGGARLVRSACIRIPLSIAAVGADGLVVDEQLRTAASDILQTLARSLVAEPPREQPSWQAYSSLYPMVMRPGTAAFRDRGA
ncbi:NADPH-dependent FMN reductase [Mangrovihabitans endophyticus]|uniref:NADPH-dependent FMN reductase-like domain-containing protein n=1 Tax=Mangrovihabitans endophyticus TaxID=1751298 RepID=A0A8J3BVA9_9ACTN|nr:NADPH-dependent FMN reductase [Mangrovihabitans endophyticus]GGK76983.1 hypothetical protein GCM10012284_08670 [Mangrovihabitans endophyticus]